MRHLSIILTLASLAAGMAVSACDRGEQGRVLLYEEGTYLGEPDPPLPEETVETLRQRANLQSGG